MLKEGEYCGRTQGNQSKLSVEQAKEYIVKQLFQKTELLGCTTVKDRQDRAEEAFAKSIAQLVDQKDFLCHVDYSVIFKGTDMIIKPKNLFTYLVFQGDFVPFEKLEGKDSYVTARGVYTFEDGESYFRSVGTVDGIVDNISVDWVKK